MTYDSELLLILQKPNLNSYDIIFGKWLIGQQILPILRLQIQLFDCLQEMKDMQMIFQQIGLKQDEGIPMNIQLSNVIHFIHETGSYEMHCPYEKAFFCIFTYLITEDISCCLYSHYMSVFCENFMQNWALKLTCNV